MLRSQQVGKMSPIRNLRQSNRCVKSYNCVGKNCGVAIKRSWEDGVDGIVHAAQREDLIWIPRTHTKKSGLVRLCF